ncbi:MAG: radical SAM protein [Candidatus Parcubacteria bacterium]|nr:radical SAM protein [Candidatus Parcubacteria bacterium]
MKKNLVFVCSNQCQHNCVYCLTKEPWRDKLFEKVTITDTNLILKYIKIFGKYTNEMILTGFEPTLNKDFFKIISFAANNGIDYISVHTNGVLLGRRFIEKMKVYKEYLKIFISFPSANEKLYNGITQSKDFKKVFNALKLLQKNDFLFFVEIVICSLNIKDIENTIKKLDELGIKRIIFIHVITYKKRYNIKYSDSLPILEKVFKKFPDIKFQIYEVPPCILKKYPTLKKIRLNKCATNNELNIGEKICISKEQYKPVSCRRVLNICKGCDYLNNNQCSGAGRVYLDLYGDSEFKKFTRH